MLVRRVKELEKQLVTDEESKTKEDAVKKEPMCLKGHRMFWKLKENPEFGVKCRNCDSNLSTEKSYFSCGQASCDSDAVCKICGATAELNSRK